MVLVILFMDALDHPRATPSATAAIAAIRMEKYRKIGLLGLVAKTFSAAGCRRKCWIKTTQSTHIESTCTIAATSVRINVT